MAIECTIEERGNGFPDDGDYCVESKSGQLYRVLSTGRIQTATSGNTARPNFVDAQVEEADWDECAEGDVHTAAVILVGESEIDD